MPTECCITVKPPLARTSEGTCEMQEYVLFELLLTRPFTVSLKPHVSVNNIALTAFLLEIMGNSHATVVASNSAKQNMGRRVMGVAYLLVC